LGAHSIDVECPAENILEQLPINISGLRLNQSLLVKDLQLPEGLKAMHDPELVIVQVAPPHREAEPTEIDAGAAEPELIRREAKADEDADEK